MSAQIANSDLDGEWTVPPASGELATGDSTRYRVTWHPAPRRVHIALFHVVTDDNVAILQHIRRIDTAGSDAADASLSEDVELSDVPAALLALVRADGFEPAEIGVEGQ